MKRIIFIILLLSSLLFFSSCNKSEPKESLPSSDTSTVQTNAETTTPAPSVPLEESTAAISEPVSIQKIKLVEKTNKAKFLLTNGIKIKYSDKAVNTEKGEIHIMLPQIQGLSSKTLEEKINKRIENDIQAELKIYMSEVEREQDFAEISVDLNANNLLCISIRGYYTPPVYSFLYRLTDGERLYLKDIFTKGTDYVSLLNRKVTEGILANVASEEYLLREPFKTIAANQNFALSPSTLYVVFHKGEGGFKERGSLAVPLSSIDAYEDVLDRYMSSQRKTQLNSDSFVLNNNIFLTSRGEVYKRDNGDLWIHYPEVSGLGNSQFEKKINSTITKDIDSLKDSSLFNNLPKGEEFGRECIAVIEFYTSFNSYGILSIERTVFTYSTISPFEDLHKVYSFDLINSREVDAKALVNSYFLKNEASRDIFVNSVKKDLRQQCVLRKVEFKDVADYNIDYSYIEKNAVVFFTKRFDEDELLLNVSFILNTSEGVPFRADCQVPLKDIYQGAPEDFFGVQYK